jgi:membrane-bound hydrogenase subunit beta
MANEEAITKELLENFPFLAEKVAARRERRVFAEVDYANFAPVFDYAVKRMDFSHLCTISGTDDGDNLGAIYHLSRRDGTLLNIKTAVPKEKPEIDTVSSYFPGGVLYERELIDLLGFKVNGLPPQANRYPLQDDWPEGQYPLRKDWTPEMLDQASSSKKGE